MMMKVNTITAILYDIEIEGVCGVDGVGSVGEVGGF